MEKSDAEKLIGAFALAISASLPQELAERIARHLDALAQQIQRNEADTRMHMLCTELAETIRGVHPPRH